MATVPARYPRQAAIEAYGNGGFRFAGMSHRGSLLCLPSGVYAWEVSRVTDLTPAHLESALAEAARLDLLILGTGSVLAPPPPDVNAACRTAAVRLEIMDTGAACRTYNVLLAEGRRVAAALVAVD